MTKDKDLKPIHPGEILREELLKTYSLTPQQLAQDLKVEEKVVTELISEQAAITPELSYRLGLYGGVREDYGLDLQKHYELSCGKERFDVKQIREQVHPLST